MSESEPTFGARYAASDSIAARIELEASEQRRAPYASVDAALDEVIVRALQGERVAKFIRPRSKKKSERVGLLVAMDETTRAAVHEHFEVENQEKRGSWHVPADEALSLGLIHMAYWMRQNERLALNMAYEETGGPQFRGEPEAVAIWVLEPLGEDLFLPLKLRGWYWLGKKDTEQQEKYWTIIEPLYAALGLDPAPLDRFRPGTGWSEHSTDDVIALRKALVESWAAAGDSAAARYRAYRIGQVVDRYYAKAKEGKATRKQVLTKPLGRTLTAYFGGDWLAFLNYLGEEVHPREEIVQALPDTKLIVGGAARAAEVAAEHGVAAEEVERMLAAYWQQSDASSPVEQRVAVLKRYWAEFDEIHARQASGMPSLWGLVGESAELALLQPPREDGDDPDAPNTLDPELHQRLFSRELNDDIDRLWGGAMLTRWPDRIVSEPAPHHHVAEALGPVLRFWEGAALTAWFICEGPYSRTDLDGLANYHHRELDALAQLGCPIGGDVFRELRAAESGLGPEEHLNERMSEHEVVPGISMTVTVGSGGTKRAGFEMLRDIITRHRRAWAEQYLDGFLRKRWETDLRAAGEAYHRSAAQRGRPPTAKMFAKAAAQPANLWFGGDITGVYGALGLKAPPAPTASHLLPRDHRAFAQRLYELLAGGPYVLPPTWNEDPEGRERHNQLDGLARQCLQYVQFEEALGRPPELKEFGRSGFEYRGPALAEDVDVAWSIYSEAVHEALAAVGDVSGGAAAVSAAASVGAEPASVTSTAGAAQSESSPGPPTQSPPAPPSAPPAWHPDPWGQHRLRWWDGRVWTGHVSD